MVFKILGHFQFQEVGQTPGAGGISKMYLHMISRTGQTNHYRASAEWGPN